MITFKLSTYDYELVTGMLGFEGFESVSIGEQSAVCTVTEEQGHALIDRLGGELVEKGFRDDSEPNQHGHRIEALIDTIGRDLWDK